MSVRLEQFAKYAGIATTVIEWSALLLYFIKQPIYFGLQYPISHYATLAETRWVFVGCYVLAALCFWIFARHYLVKHYTVPLRLFGISLFLFACTGLFPFDFTDAVSTAIHSLLAAISGMTFLIGMVILARRANDGHLFRVTIGAVLFSFTFSLIFLLLPKESQLIFTFEAASWLVLQLWTIWISFYTFKKNA